MDQIYTYILLLLSLSGTFSKYTYIKEEMYWRKAQTYCRQNYTDLAPVANKQDLDKLKEINKDHKLVWIGLERITYTSNWKWSGGGMVSENLWALGQPDDGPTDEVGYIDYNGWNDAHGNTQRPSFCYRAIVVMEEKTWEEALEYCRKHYNDLASVASETEMLLIQKELNKSVTKGLIWIGLRFFSGDWLWVDGQNLGYEAWGQGGKPSCPQASMECAALLANFTSSNSGNVVNSLLSTSLSSTAFDDAVAQSKGGVWGAYNCEEKLSFICY